MRKAAVGFFHLVAGLAARWGWRRRRGGRMVTWFELRHG
jgi:hypothetical protein